MTKEELQDGLLRHELTIYCDDLDEAIKFGPLVSDIHGPTWGQEMYFNEYIIKLLRQNDGWVYFFVDTLNILNAMRRRPDGMKVVHFTDIDLNPHVIKIEEQEYFQILGV